MKVRDILVPNDPALKAIAHLYRSVFPRKDVDFKQLQLWTSIYPGALTVLEESDRVWGFSRCLPISEGTYKEMMTSRGPLRPKNILDDRAIKQNVLGGLGNCCYVSMIAYDPNRKVESFDRWTLNLFEHLRNRFYRIRLKKLICQSENAIEAAVIRKVGCKKAYDLDDSAGRSVWYFDEACIPEDGLSQLSEVFHDMWLAEPQLELTPTQRQVLASLMLEPTPKEAASFLDMNYQTFLVHKRNIVARCKKRKDLFPNGATTQIALDYCHEHPIEFKVPSKITTKNRRN